MLDIVDVGESSLESYRRGRPRRSARCRRRTARALRGARVLHINATPYGGGVSELLRSVVPLLNDQGLVADWRIISGDEPFFQVTKAIHNGLQGAPVELDDADKARYLATSRANAAGFDHRLRLHLRPRSAAGGAARVQRQGARALDLALAHRHRARQPGGLELPAPVPGRVRRVDLHDGRVRPRRPADAVRGRSSRRPSIRRTRRTCRCPRRPRARCWSGSGCAPTSRWSPRSRASIPGRIRWASSRRIGWRAQRGARTSSWRWSGRWPSTIPRAGTMYRAIRKEIARRQARARLHQPGRRRQHRGERVPGAVERRDPEVAARGVRPGRGRGAVEGDAGRRRPRRRHPAADGRRHGRHAGRQRRGVRARDGQLLSDPDRARGAWGRAAASGCGGTSSSRASCSTSSSLMRRLADRRRRRAARSSGSRTATRSAAWPSRPRRRRPPSTASPCGSAPRSAAPLRRRARTLPAGERPTGARGCDRDRRRAPVSGVSAARPARRERRAPPARRRGRCRARSARVTSCECGGT